MEARLIDTTSTAHDDALAHCLIAIELSKASWVVRQTCKSSLDSPHISARDDRCQQRRYSDPPRNFPERISFALNHIPASLPGLVLATANFEA